MKLTTTRLSGLVNSSRLANDSKKGRTSLKLLIRFVEFQHFFLYLNDMSALVFVFEHNRLSGLVNLANGSKKGRTSLKLLIRFVEFQHSFLYLNDMSALVCVFEHIRESLNSDTSLNSFKQSNLNINAKKKETYQIYRNVGWGGTCR